MNFTSVPYSPPPTSSAFTSKRHSLNVLPGPRPLHLVDGQVPQVQATLPPRPLSIHVPSYHASTSTGGHSEMSTHLSGPRRKSSISYNPKSRGFSMESGAPRSPLGPRHLLARSTSFDPASSHTSVSNLKGEERRSAPSSSTGEKERPPLTLAEKHGELLHFIAQKESKCLELRSQLAMHEAELLQLKRRWERIVSRGFGLDNPYANSTSHSSYSYSAPNTSHGGTTGSAIMLEGIKEGVQGVSRFILGHPTSSASTSSSSPPHSMRRSHSTSQSSSSVSTYATRSTRPSRSSSTSASSIEEEGDVVTPLPSSPACDEASGHGNGDKGEPAGQVLMVQDIGAMPTMYPNPAFLQRQSNLELVSEEDSILPSPSISVGSAKMHRRKSREVPSVPSPISSPVNPTGQKGNVKRASVNGVPGGSAFPPVSSIPGLGSLTVGMGAGASASAQSWVGSVGKKWEELQKGATFSKNQKRASILLSDVSQTIASALSSPSHLSSTPASASASPSPFASCSSSSSSLNTPPLPHSPSLSLLDDEDPEDALLASVMTPDSKAPSAGSISKSSSSRSITATQPAQSKSPMSEVKGGSSLSAGQGLLQDEEEEWNW